MVFERAYATDVLTQPAYTSILTGQRSITSGIVSRRREVVGIERDFALIFPITDYDRYTRQDDNGSTHKPKQRKGLAKKECADGEVQYGHQHAQ